MPETENSARLDGHAAPVQRRPAGDRTGHHQSERRQEPLPEAGAARPGARLARRSRSDAQQSAPGFGQRAAALFVRLHDGRVAPGGVDALRCGRVPFVLCAEFIGCLNAEVAQSLRVCGAMHRVKKIYSCTHREREHINRANYNKYTHTWYMHRTTTTQKSRNAHTEHVFRIYYM